jgi:hypothetical protein
MKLAGGAVHVFVARGLLRRTATMRNYGIWLGLGLVVACNKAEPAGVASASSAPVAAAPSTAASSEAAPPASAIEAAPTPAAPSAGAPESFKGGTKENVASAVGLGCEATSLNGWLQLLCRKKNGTGGHPVKATITTPGAEPAAPAGREPGAEPTEGEAAGEEVTVNEQGELNIVVPFSGDEKRDVAIEWTDTRYTLHVTGAKATLEWAASGIPHRRACQQVLDESKAVLSQAQKAEGPARLTTTETAKLSRFGVCQPGGLGSWALALKAAAGVGEGAARQHHLELEVVRVDIDGNRKSTSFGSLDVAPSGLELPALQVYDYDDDGRDELIVSYDVKATSSTAQAMPSPIWSFTDAGVVAYAKAPPVGGGVFVEQLDFDMRPDLSTYGGFVAYLGADCGLKTCPPRITGPKLYFHSQPDGAFADSDEPARSALKRAGCQNKPLAVVVETGGTLNAVQTAKNLVCAKAWGVGVEALKAELSGKQAALCGEAASCALKSAFESWLEKPLPFELTAAPKK